MINQLTPELLLAAGGTIVAAVVWFVRLEGRVNGHDKEITLIHEQTQEGIKRLDEKIEGLTDFLLRQHLEKKN